MYYELLPLKFNFDTKVVMWDVQFFKRFFVSASSFLRIDNFCACVLFTN